MTPNIRRAATSALALLACGLGGAAPALAQETAGGAGLSGTGGGGASTSRVATPASAAKDPIVVQTLTLTRTQTKSVQRRVRVTPDGALGARTRTAIRRYQRRRALLTTGRPNVETLRAMRLRIADKLEAQLRAQAGAAASPETLPAAGGAAARALAVARTAIGVPYRSGGTTMKGFDCSGLVQWAFAQAGVPLPRVSFDQYRVGVAVPKAAIAAGDLVFFDTAGPGASHVGIAASATTVISATTRGVMEHSIASGYWASHFLGARRVVG